MCGRKKKTKREHLIREELETLPAKKRRARNR
jgi:hypothetical protein